MTMTLDKELAAAWADVYELEAELMECDVTYQPKPRETGQRLVDAKRRLVKLLREKGQS